VGIETLESFSVGRAFVVVVWFVWSVLCSGLGRGGELVLVSEVFVVLVVDWCSFLA